MTIELYYSHILLLKRQLKKKFQGTKYTLDEATRIFLWSKEGFEYTWFI